jgi:hypothetical protein
MWHGLISTLSLAGKSRPITDGRLRGDVITFSAGDARYEGRVNGNSIRGIGRSWSATRVQAAASAATK